MATIVTVAALELSVAIIEFAPELSVTVAGTETVVMEPVVPPMVKAAAVVVPEQTSPAPQVRTPAVDTVTVDAAAPVTIVPN